ncbi:50S ribosomal protein L31 [Patescibacteria group bacterium]|nr:50S ribosomal protein L31 [Patescibacteria group bacterium]
MKPGIHPTYYDNATVTCACGNVITAGSVIKEQRTDICSACHPFYTGKKTLVDRAGRVDKFKAKMAKVQELADKTLENNSGKKDKSDEKYMTIDAMKGLKKNEVKKMVMKLKLGMNGTE